MTIGKLSQPDAIVIGAGIVGSATAFELARERLKVVILERDAPNRGGSGSTEGNFHIQTLTPRPHGRPRDSARYVPLQYRSSRIWADLETELDASVEFKRSGGFAVAETEQDLEIVRFEHRLELEGGIRTELFTGDEARRENPLIGPTVVGAVYCPEDGFVNALKVVPSFLAAGQRYGLEIYSFSPVTHVAANSRGYEVVAGSRRFEAPVVVNATGPWIHLVARLLDGIQLEMLPTPIQVSATVRLTPTMHHLVQHVSKNLIVKQAKAGNVHIGGGWYAGSLDLNGRTPASPTGMLANVRLAERILPFLEDVAVLRTWTGPYAVTPDELPIVGELTGYPGYFVAGGPHAFTHGPLIGKAIRDLVLKRPPLVDLTGLGPDRLVRQEAGDQVEDVRSN